MCLSSVYPYQVWDSGNIYFRNNGPRQESRHLSVFIFLKSQQYLTDQVNGK